MGKDRIKTVLLLFYLVSFVFLPTNSNSNISNDESPPPFFTIGILYPENNVRCCSWFNILSEQLPKIGIGIETLDGANWSEIFERTWSYSGIYPIPTYSEGGYDILLYYYLSDLDFNPIGLYDSASITPSGDNFLQYENHLMDIAIANFTQTFNILDRIDWAKEIQALLYEDIPELAVAYLQTLFIHDSNLVGWNPLLWYKDYQCMANWSIHQETTFNYAQVEPVDNFHIYLSTKRSNAQWLNQIYTGLIERKSNLNGFYGSNIASKWSTNDGSKYIVNLNPNVTWADGTPLNASDIEYSFELRANLSTTYSLTDICYIMTNITIIDEYTLEFEFLIGESVFNENLLALPIIPKHIWQNIASENHRDQADLWAKTNPIKLLGAGPYYLFNYNNETDIIHLKRNNYYKNWTGINPHFEDIYFKYYSNRELTLIDITAGKIDLIDPLFNFNFDDIPINTTFTVSCTGNVQKIAINNKNPYLGTGELCPISSPESAKNIRKAISYAIPREIICDELYNGLASPGVTTWSNIALDFDKTLEPFEYNLTLAKSLMPESGFMYDFCTSNIFGISLGIIYVISVVSLVGISYLVVLRKNNN